MQKSMMGFSQKQQDLCEWCKNCAIGQVTITRPRNEGVGYTSKCANHKSDGLKTRMSANTTKYLDPTQFGNFSCISTAGPNLGPADLAEFFRASFAAFRIASCALINFPAREKRLGCLYAPYGRLVSQVFVSGTISESVFANIVLQRPDWAGVTFTGIGNKKQFYLFYSDVCVCGGGWRGRSDNNTKYFRCLFGIAGLTTDLWACLSVSDNHMSV